MNEDEIWRASKAQEAIRALRSLVCKVFPPRSPSQDAEASVLLHKDLHSGNILLSKEGDISAVLDWEFVSALPLWKSCDFPLFLQGSPNNEEPDKDSLLNKDEEVDRINRTKLRDDERTLLRKCFVEEMERGEPEWVTVHNSSQLQREFDYAVTHFHPESYTEVIGDWIAEFLKEGSGGSVKSLKLMIDERMAGF